MASVFDISEKVGTKTKSKTPAQSGYINEFSKVVHIRKCSKITFWTKVNIIKC